MLEKLKVENFAIIENIEVSFSSGMTVLTGQTGAGKSLIIDCIGLLLGARADLDMIRYGAKDALIEGTFTEIPEAAKEFLDTLGINGNRITIKRSLNSSGKSKATINDISININDIKTLGYFLGDIHVQHDTYRLINKENYLSFLDDFKDKKFLKVYNQYILDLDFYKEKLKIYNDALKRKNDLTSELEYLKFQKEELEALDLEEGLDEELKTEIAKLSNFDKIYKVLNESYECLDEKCSIDYLYDMKDELESISSYDEEYNNISKLVNDAYYNLEEVKSYLYKAKDSLDFDPDYLEQLQQKSYNLEKIKEKYHKSVNELIEYLAKITLDINLSENFDEAMEELSSDVEKAYQSLKNSSKALKEYRMTKAKTLSTDIVKICRGLDLEHTEFVVKFNEVEFNNIYDSSIFKENGIDEIDFLITFNLGEPVKPLSKVASGGELSRIMLAFKTIYLKNHPLSFIVFDEIDSGISGSTARKIARSMKDISKDTQVLAITHLANVASVADNHIHISKEEIEGRTYTRLETLEGSRRVEEIAMMLSGLGLSKETLEAAKLLLEDK